MKPEFLACRGLNCSDIFRTVPIEQALIKDFEQNQCWTPMEEIGVVLNGKSGQEVAKSSNRSHGSRSRDDVRYSQARVFRLHYFQDGARRECADFSVRIQHQGRRECFNLDTPNKAVAAERARNLYRHLVANGWEAARTEFKPQTPLARGSLITVGDFLDALRQAETGNLQSLKIMSNICVGSWRGLLR
jgi:hypothetical protein